MVPTNTGGRTRRDGKGRNAIDMKYSASPAGDKEPRIEGFEKLSVKPVSVGHDDVGAAGRRPRRPGRRRDAGSPLPSTPLATGRAGRRGRRPGTAPRPGPARLP